MAKSEWLKRFRQGSFRGVEFKTESHSSTGGRRKQDHEFPQRNEGKSEDLGKRLNKFSLELFVLGDDYFEQRDNLIIALEAEGPGQLVHPYLGEITVQAGVYSLSETVTEGRVARFTVEFTKAGEGLFPASVEDELAKVEGFADVADGDSKSFFESVFSVAAQAAHVIESATDSMNDAVDFMENAIKAVTEPIAEVTFLIKNFKAAAQNLANAPGELADRVSEMFNTMLDTLSDDPETTRLIATQFVGFSYPEIVGQTRSSDRIRSNNDGLQNLFKQQAAFVESQAAVQVEFSASRAAVNARDRIAENFDELLGTELVALDPDGESFTTITIDDNLFQSMKDLQTSVIKVLPEIGLAESSEFISSKTLPALVIAYQLFKDIEKEAEIVDENNIEHPGFVPGGETIEVIGVGV